MVKGLVQVVHEETGRAGPVQPSAEKSKVAFIAVYKYLMGGYREGRARVISEVVNDWRRGNRPLQPPNADEILFIIFLCNEDVYKLGQVSQGSGGINMLGYTQSSTKLSLDVIGSALNRRLDMMTSMALFQTKLFNDSVMFDFKIDNMSNLHLHR